MSTFLKILFAVIITAALTYFGMKEFDPGYKVLSSSSDTTTTVTTTITKDENTFTAVEVGNIKRVLMDSLKAVYGKKIEALLTSEKLTSPRPSPWEGEGEDSSRFAYLSEVDTNFVAKDSSGNVTDSIHVVSSFISNEPIPDNSVHLVQVDHKSFTKEIETKTTIKDSIVVEAVKSLWEKFKVEPGVTAGYGLINKQFDVVVGVGLKYEFDLISFFK